MELPRLTIPVEVVARVFQVQAVTEGTTTLGSLERTTEPLDQLRLTLLGTSLSKALVRAVAAETTTAPVEQVVPQYLALVAVAVAAGF